jgi:hypothetical protein
MAEPAAPKDPRRRRRAFISILIVTALFIIVPFLTWYWTWFGRALSDDEIGQQLAELEKPRKIQHALLQIEQKIVSGDAQVHRFYPQLAALKDHQLPEIRLTAAWVMGQDNRAPSFHEALTQLVTDVHPMVRRNAALGLVRFGDARGRDEILAMLRPYPMLAIEAGDVTVNVVEGDGVAPGGLVARLNPAAGGTAIDLRSPVPGRVRQVDVGKGERVAAGDAILTLGADPGQVWEALRALYLIGGSESLADVDRYARGEQGMPEKVREQARLTAENIRRRGAAQ